MSARDPEFLALPGRQALSADTDVELEADGDRGVAQTERVQHLADQGADPGLGLRLAIHQTAEQDVVLQGCGAVVALAVVELDAGAQLRRQTLGESAPRGEEPVFHRVVDQAKAVARLDVAEGQRDQARPVGGGHGVQAFATQPLQQEPNVGELVGGDEAVLLEQRIVGRETRE